MKKFIVFAVVLALLVPTLAMAATEFSLGGFVKLDAFWDSTQANKNMNGGWVRDNTPAGGMHGRMKFTAQGSRFNFTIKGPDLWGAKTNGFIEMDFDSVEQAPSAVSVGTGAAAWQRTASNSYTPRLRHAMFRFNWPETELLFGQYWSMFSEWYAELAEDGPLQTTGTPTARLPQIRVTQKFLGWGTASLLIGDANPVINGQSYSTNDTSGESTATPQIQGKLMYQQDLWGKAAYYGNPIPFTLTLVAGWQRSQFAQGAQAMKTWQNNSYSAAMANVIGEHTTLDPWMIQGNAFVPVIPTSSANLAGTASVLASWYVGQGLDAFGLAGLTNFYRFNNNRFGFVYEPELQKRFGGMVQGQYYFTNQWFLTAVYGVSQQFGADLTSREPAARQAAVTLNPQGFKYAVASPAGDPVRTYQQAEVCLWYRPIQAIKFGLEYAYGQQNWFQSVQPGGGGGNFLNAIPNCSSASTAHRVEFVGFFYF